MTSPEALAPGSIPAERPTVTLYIAGDSPQSAVALANLRLAFDALPEGDIPPIEVIDVYESPLEAMNDGVVVTPTLILQHLGKRRTMFGDLSDLTQTAAVLASLTTPSS